MYVNIFYIFSLISNQKYAIIVDVIWRNYYGTKFR